MNSLPKFSKKRLAEIEAGTFKPGQKKRREPTGEIALLDRLMTERGPFSEITGVPLAPKGTPRYHWQIFHILGKGEYPELRLEDFNVILTTPEEQEAWTSRKWTLRERPEWRWVFEKEAALKLEVRTK